MSHGERSSRCLELEVKEVLLSFGVTRALLFARYRTVVRFGSQRNSLSLLTPLPPFLATRIPSSSSLLDFKLPCLFLTLHTQVIPSVFVTQLLRSPFDQKERRCASLYSRLPLLVVINSHLKKGFPWFPSSLVLRDNASSCDARRPLLLKLGQARRG